MLLYLKKHGEHVDSIDLRGDYGAVLRELPPSMQLSSLQLEMLRLQLQRGAGFHGVLGAAATVAALKKLRLRSCELHSGGWEAADGVLTAALSVLPAGLQHLSISNLTCDSPPLRLPTTVLQQLQQLTCLELANVELQGPDEASSALQPLQALTRLADLRLAGNAAVSITANMLSGTHHMTRMQLCSNSFEPGALAGKTRLQHLDLALCRVPGGAAGVAQLLSHLQPLHQLTHLDLMRTLRDVSEDTPPAAAYAALTTSSKLQHLNISTNRLPAHVWQHMFPVGRQLLHLTSLDISAIQQPLDLAGGFAPAPEGSLLVSCCPSLQSLSLVCLQFEGLLPALQGLSTLHTLGVGAANCNAEHLLQLTQLKQLSTLKFVSPPYVNLTCRVSCTDTTGHLRLYVVNKRKDGEMKLPLHVLPLA
jgi:hypothetical protein